MAAASAEVRRTTVPEIKARKGQSPIVCLTCYHAHTARLLDNHVHVILVGDNGSHWNDASDGSGLWRLQDAGTCDIKKGPKAG